MKLPPATLPLALLIAACTAAAGPPEVHWGIDECSGCHMILSAPEYAAAARNASGEEERFDDVGCMAGWLAERPSETWQVWVHDADVERWHPAQDAWFARSDARATPMGSGLTAHGTKAAAQAASPRQEPLTWSALLATRSNAHTTTPSGGSP
jgi:copper chaperone NosL